MDTQKSETGTEKSSPQTGTESADSSYRTAIRSNILKRIYEKNARLSANILEDSSADRERQRHSENGITNQRAEEQEEKYRSAVPLSNEWRKTLERILNYETGYIDGQLEISRKDALCFFIQKEWEKEETAESGKGRRGKKKSKKSPTPERETSPSRIIVKRHVTWQSMTDANPIKRSSILTDTPVKDSEAIEAVHGYRLQRESLYERFIMRPLQSFDYLHTLSYLFRRNDSSRVFRFFAWLYDWLHQYNPATQIVPQLMSTQPPSIQRGLNNNQFLLVFASAEISLSKHYLMDEENRLLRLLHSAYERFQKSVSTRRNHQLVRLNEVIAMVSTQMEQSIGDETERQMDIDLLQRLLEQQRAIVCNRRKALIELLRTWDRVVSHKATCKLVTSNCLNLALEEVEHVKEEVERKEYALLVEENVRLEKLVQKKGTIDMEAVKAITFLADGRLPGEPKFSSIELTYTRPKTDKNGHFDMLYTIQVSMGEKALVQFEPQYLESDFANLKWAQPVSLAIPWFPNSASPSTYSSLTNSDEMDSTNIDDQYKQYLPIISIYEKPGRRGAKNRQESRLLWKETLTNLPRFYQKSVNNAKLLESDFEFLFKEEEKENRLRVRGSITMSIYWALLPNDAKSIIDSTSAETLFDEEKRQIKQMIDLKQIDQTLHDLRYLDTISLEHFAIDSSIIDDSMRRIQLMDLCLRQKYHIELNTTLLEKENITKRRGSKAAGVKESVSKLPPGILCTDEEFESNKRFQMLLYRSNIANRHSHNLRFLPLTNVTSVMLQHLVASEKTEKRSFDLLLEYIRTSCEEQEKRIAGLTKTKRKKRKNADGEGLIFHDWCLATSSKDGGSKRQLLMSTPNWLQTIVQVLDKGNLEREYSTSADSFSGGYFPPGRILTLEDIIREEPVESFESEFSLFSPFTNLSRSKLNPSRKDRRKAAISLSEAIDREVAVVLSLQHAINVPLRERTEVPHEEEDEDEDDLDRFLPCSTYVEMECGNKNISSSIAEGSTTTWNENFRFSLKIDPHQYLTLNLFEVTKSVRSNSFSSEATGKSVSKESLSGDETATTTEFSKRYFGQLKIPVSSILFNSKIEGTFSLTTPYFLQGYKSISTSTNKVSRKSKLKLLGETEDSRANDGKLLSAVTQLQSLYSDAAQTLLGALPDICLSIFVTIDPPIEPIPGANFSSKNGSLEATELIDHCQRWRTQLETYSHTRHYLCLVENLQHKLVLACRYLAPVKPPDVNDLIQMDQIVPQQPQQKGKGAKGEGQRAKASLKKLVHREALYLNLLLRYVSLIPSFSAHPPIAGEASDLWWRQCKSSATVWLSVSQFLSFRMGFHVEHALYLACMLQYLDRHAYLLYGNALLEGPTGYVILYPTEPSISSSFSSKDGNSEEYEPIVINPRSGQQFSVRDYNITIHSIDCIVTNDNIYANVQRNAHPNSMQYNLRKSSHWQPLFSSTKEIARFASFQGHDEPEFTSIQSEVIDYGDSISHDSAVNLESRLETYLRDQLMAWRRQQAATFTPFNRYCQQIIRRLLPQLETHACLASGNGTVYSQQQQVLSLEEALIQELEKINAVHSIIGYPFHVSPMVDFEQIARLVHSTGVHSIDTAFGGGEGDGASLRGATASGKMAEFIISVYVHAYPANVHSIWVYIGALMPKT